jgi:NADH:ubiquinone oxidoreductase subunit 3 (subunit A)
MRFDAFDDARMKFDVRFYLVAILFIIFDLEVTFLFPWAVVYGRLGVYGFWSMMVFLGVLTIGFAYGGRRERSKGLSDSTLVAPAPKGISIRAPASGQLG